jgi:chromatin remodeling complex protein RSC6
MVRASKPSASTPVAAAAPAVSNVVIDAAASTSTKKASAKKTKAGEATTAAPAPVVVAAPVVVETPVVAAPETVVEPASSAAKLAEIDANIQQLSSILATVKSDFKVLSKTIAREQKLASKSSKGNRKVSASRKPSGFIKPTLISDELARFLGKSIGSEMARTDVSKEINQYIRTNNLQDKENGRKIHPDAKLSSLLNIQPNDEPLTYFNLQRFMKHHFVKTVATA